MMDATAEPRVRRPNGTTIHYRLLAAAAVIAALLALFAARSWFAADAPQQPSPAQSARQTTAARIAGLEARVAARPDDLRTLVQLALSYLQRVREIGDPSFYALADQASQRALVIAPEDPNALVAAGAIANSKHDFAGALSLADRAIAAEPTLTAAYGVRTDALVELGRYDEAIAAAQRMADLHPDFASYSRISYIRELHGDIPGAVDAMREAVDAGSTVPQDVAWGRALIGNLLLNAGDVDGAARDYQQAALRLPDDPNTRAGLARLALARGDAPEAERQLRAAIDKRPLPEYLILLGDLLASEGRATPASQQYATVRAIEQLFAASGVNVDVELSLFEADHGGDSEAAYRRALAAYELRPSVTAADAVAWTAYRSGRLEEARARIAEATRLATRDARFAYHAGMIALASGDGAAASRALRAAVEGRGMLTPLEFAAAEDALGRVSTDADGSGD